MGLEEVFGAKAPDNLYEDNGAAIYFTNIVHFLLRTEYIDMPQKQLGYTPCGNHTLANKENKIHGCQTFCSQGMV